MSESEEAQPMKDYGYIKGAQTVIDLWPIGKKFYLEITAAQAYERMADAARVDGIEFNINSAFRSRVEQDRLYRRYIIETGEWQKGGRLGPKPAAAAPSGWSTHQQGISLDINVAGTDAKALEWLRVHAVDFGFINDVGSEPWHWSYMPDKAGIKVA